MSKKKGASKTQKDKDALPLKLSIATVRRAVELAMGHGYFLAVMDQAVYHSEGREFQSEEVKKTFADDATLNPEPEIYKPIVDDHIDSLRSWKGWDIVELLISAAQDGAHNSESLAAVNAAIKKRGGRSPNQLNKDTRERLTLYIDFRLQGLSDPTARTKTANEHKKKFARLSKELESVDRAVNKYLNGGRDQDWIETKKRLSL